MRYHDAMLGCQRNLGEAFHNVKHFIAQQQRQLDDHRLRDQNGNGADYSGKDEQWGVDKDQGFHGPEAKEIRRGVGVPSKTQSDFLLTSLVASCTPRALP